MATGGKRNLESIASSNRSKKSKNPSTAFEKGAITRLYFENFVTYDHVEFYPGPHLNVIVGPNGTGKSTIVCGICLGLAGKVSILGRASSVAEYIKHGCNKAVIEVELHHPDRNIIVRREISRVTSGLAWHLNGQSVSQKKVEETVNDLGIQVANLCQFLPQDKVSDFARMSQQELLENTEKAINPKLYDDHCKLKDDCKNQRDMELSLTRTKEKLDQEIAQNARLEQDVKNYNDRQTHIQLKSQLEEKKLWLLYENKRMEFEVLKSERDEVKRKTDTENSRLQPIRSRQDDIQKQVKKIEVDMSRRNDEIKQLSNSAAQANRAIEDVSGKLQDIEDELSSKRQEEANRQHKIAELKVQLTALESELEQIESDENVQPAIDKVTQEMQNLSNDMTAVQRKGEETQREASDINNDVRVLERELKNLRDINNRRCENLKSVHADTYKAVAWLRQNGDRFRGTVNEPMILTLNAVEPKFAKYIEARVGFRDLIAFICEDPEDVDTFLSEVRDKMNLRVNAMLMPAEPSNSFKPPRSIQYYKQFQFQNYLRELIDCPEAVMRCLCKLYQVHSIPVGNAYTKERISQVMNNAQDFSVIYTENHEYTVRKSRYSGDISTCCKELQNPRLLSSSTDVRKEQDLVFQIQEKRKLLDDKTNMYRKRQEELRKLESQMEQLRKEKKRLSEQKNLKRTLQQKIGMKNDSIVRMERERIDLEGEERKASKKRKEIRNKEFTLLETLKTSIEKGIRASQEKIRLSGSQSTLLREDSKLTIELREKEGTVQALQAKLQELSTRAMEVKEAAKQMLNEAKKLSGVKSPNDIDQLRHFQCLPDTIEEIETKIHDLNARIQCTTAVDEGVVHDFERRKRKIEELGKSIELENTRIENYKKEMEVIRSRWIGPLQELIENINKNFSNFFKIMRCSGEVDLKVPDNPEDFEKYGVRIKVKFRDAEQLCELTTHHQSGGERSVSTVLYMMALQELTRCPFRCVDEINQGMDPINERIVFELVVQTATKDHTSQYFLLTPKLLPDLTVNENTTVLFVHNGPFILDHREWSLRKFVKRRSHIQL